MDPATEADAVQGGSSAQKRPIGDVDGPNSSPHKEGGRKTFPTRQAEFREQQDINKEDVGLASNTSLVGSRKVTTILLTITYTENNGLAIGKLALLLNTSHPLP